jgi:hypothetical protein
VLQPALRNLLLLFRRTGAKAKNLALRHPMNNSHVADPSQALYTIPTQAPEIGRTTGSKLDVREPAQPMKGTGE